MEKTLLFCLNHAGGNIAFYRPLAAKLPPYIHFEPLELPGHGVHRNNTLLEDFTAMTAETCQQIKASLEKHQYPPYALFGHSMGASLAFNALHTLKGQSMYYSPQLLCLSSPRALQSSLIPLQDTPTSKLLDFKFFEEYLKTELPQNSPEDMQQILHNPNFMAYLKPIVKADLKALDSWFSPPMAPLDIPILLLHGKTEKIQTAYRWATRTTRSFAIKTFEGGHLYMVNQWQQLADCLDLALQNKFHMLRD